MTYLSAHLSNLSSFHIKYYIVSSKSLSLSPPSPSPYSTFLPPFSSPFSPFLPSFPSSTYPSPSPPSPLPPLLPLPVCFPHRAQDDLTNVQVMSHFTLFKLSSGSRFIQDKSSSPYNGLESSTCSEKPAPIHTIPPVSYPVTLSISLSSPTPPPPRALSLPAAPSRMTLLHTFTAPSLSSETRVKCHLIKCLAWAPYYKIAPSTITLSTL